MNTQAQLEQRHAGTWQQLEVVLLSLESAKFWAKTAEHSQLPELYAVVCEHLAVVRSKGYSAQLEQRLDTLAQRAYRQIYRHQPEFFAPSLRFLGGGFSCLLRKHGGLFALSIVLLFGPLFIWSVIVLRSA